MHSDLCHCPPLLTYADSVDGNKKYVIMKDKPMLAISMDIVHVCVHGNKRMNLSVILRSNHRSNVPPARSAASSS